MARTHFNAITGQTYPYTAEEETARDAEEAAWAVEKAATAYKTNRVTGIGTTISGYGSIGEQLDQLYHDMKDGKLGVAATTGNWYVGITSVKTAIPKPS